MSKKVWKRNIPKPEMRGQKNIPSFPRPVSNPVSKKCHSVSKFPEEETGNGFWEMRSRFPKIPFVSIFVLYRSETKPEICRGNGGFSRPNSPPSAGPYSVDFASCACVSWLLSLSCARARA